MVSDARIWEMIIRVREARLILQERTQRDLDVTSGNRPEDIELRAGLLMLFERYDVYEKDLRSMLTH